MEKAHKVFKLLPYQYSLKKVLWTFLLKCIVLEISGKNNKTTKNTSVFPMFLAVMLFFPLISKAMHLSKKVQRTIFVGLQFEFFVSYVAHSVSELLLEIYWLRVSQGLPPIVFLPFSTYFYGSKRFSFVKS